MWVYRRAHCKLAPRLWEVGYYAPQVGFVVVNAYEDEGMARADVNFLNGGG